MTDRTRGEHNESASGRIATNPLLAGLVEPDCRAVIQPLTGGAASMRDELSDDGSAGREGLRS